MSTDNSVTICGNLTRDPELRFTSSQQPMANISVAVNRRWQNRQTNEWEEQTSFFDGTLWGELATNAADSLHKGDRVIVTGQIQQRSWENDEGEKRSKVELRIDDIGPSIRWGTTAFTKVDKARTPQATNSTSQPGPGEDPF